MKTLVVTLCVSLVPSLSLAFDCEAMPLREVRERSARFEEPVAIGAPTPIPQVKPAAAPVPSLIGATIGRGMLSTDYEVSWPSGDKIGKIAHEGGGYLFVNASGAVVAAAAGGLVTDGAGGKVGTIRERYSDSCSVFEVFNAKDAKVAETGCVEGSSFDAVLGGEPRAIVKNDHWLVDRFKITAISSAVDHRLVAMLVVMHNASNYRRAQQRERERRMDRPGRDHVMHDMQAGPYYGHYQGPKGYGAHGH